MSSQYCLVFGVGLYLIEKRENPLHTSQAKELDEKTGLYYYGARYLDPRYSRWISTDPALGEYIPKCWKGNCKRSGQSAGYGRNI